MRTVYLNETQIEKLQSLGLKLKENFELEIEPNEIDMSSFKLQNNLNSDIWDGDKLNSRVRLQLLDIADDFIDYIKIKWLKPFDIVLTGSICNYNWSKYSDIDIHIIIDFSKVGDDEDLIREYFNMKKNEWNQSHDTLEIYGFNVEFYVEDVNDKTVSDGIYSLETNEWIRKPNQNDKHNIGKHDDAMIRTISSEIINKIDNLIAYVKNTSDKVKLSVASDRVDRLLSTLREFRQDSLSKKGELSVGNIVYKVLRRTNYLDKLWKLKTKIYDKINSIYESNGTNGLLLTENRESKNINLARKFLIQKGYSQKQAQDILDRVRTDIPNSRIAQCKFLLSIVNMYINGELNDHRAISGLNTALKYIGSDAHVNEYDNSLNGESAETLIERFSSNASEDLESDKKLVGNNQYKLNTDYKIVKINSFEEAKNYSEYTDWCVTHYENMYYSYTHDGLGVFYFCLKNGFENVKKVKGKNCPFDKYGLSMIAISVNEDGSLNTCTTRWNHSNGGSDNSMTTQEISNLFGVNFYDIFKPRSEEEKQEAKLKKAKILVSKLEKFNNGDGNAFDFVNKFTDNIYLVGTYGATTNVGYVISNLVSSNGNFYFWPNSNIDNLIGYSEVNLLPNSKVISLIEDSTKKAYVVDKYLRMIANLPNNSSLFSDDLYSINLYRLSFGDFEDMKLYNLKNGYVYNKLGNVQRKKIYQTTESGILKIKDSNNTYYFNYNTDTIIDNINDENIYAMSHKNFYDSHKTKNYVILINNKNRYNILINENNKFVLKEWAVMIEPYNNQYHDMALVVVDVINGAAVMNFIDLSSPPYRFVCQKNFYDFDSHDDYVFLKNIDETDTFLDLKSLTTFNGADQIKAYLENRKKQKNRK